MPKTKLRVAAQALSALMLASTLGACVTNEETGNPEGWQQILPAKDPELAQLVPKEIASRGTVSAATNTPYAPNEFKDSKGTIIGVEMDLVKAAGAVLGLEVQPRQMDFSLILPAISAGSIDMGASAFTDTEERQKNYDFVDFLNAGVAWATQPGNEGNVDPDNACGMTVAVQKGTYSDTDEVQGKSDECVKQGKPAITKLVYATADAAATATILKRAEAYSSDSPVISYAIKRSNGRLAQAGEAFDTAPFGWAFKKGSPLAPAMAAALKKLIADGTYTKILTPWGLEDTAVKEVTINLKPIATRSARRRNTKAVSAQPGGAKQQ
ncbi:ABC transporter substrate-binding protein [Corynebacterium auriscanis]|uniref:ABC transporter substrate-binding protein n=1 Tax=Corynebacterium auriscanis TaxID=99807 RepID=UPI003CE70EA6